MNILFGRECTIPFTPALSRRERGQYAQIRKQGQATKRKGAGQAPFDVVMQRYTYG